MQTKVNDYYTYDSGSNSYRDLKTGAITRDPRDLSQRYKDPGELAIANTAGGNAGRQFDSTYSGNLDAFTKENQKTGFILNSVEKEVNRYKGENILKNNNVGAYDERGYLDASPELKKLGFSIKDDKSSPTGFGYFDYTGKKYTDVQLPSHGTQFHEANGGSSFWDNIGQYAMGISNGVQNAPGISNAGNFIKDDLGVIKEGSGDIGNLSGPTQNDLSNIGNKELEAPKNLGGVFNQPSPNPSNPPAKTAAATPPPNNPTNVNPYDKKRRESNRVGINSGLGGGIARSTILGGLTPLGGSQNGTRKTILGM